jgi:hypothetical protein
MMQDPRRQPEEKLAFISKFYEGKVQSGVEHDE